MEPLDETIKQQIDAMTYEEMLRKWRFAPVGDPMLQGETGTYFATRMREIEPSREEKVRVSKKIGW